MIAKHPKLQSLRMLSLPFIDYGKTTNPTTSNSVGINDDEVYPTQVIMHRLASNIMLYLWEQGSKVVLFGVSPDKVDGKVRRPQRDENRHKWPRYFYTRGRVFDTKGTESPMAIPAAIFDDQEIEDGWTVFRGRFH